MAENEAERADDPAPSPDADAASEPAPSAAPPATATRRGALEMLVAAGSAAYVAALIVPAGRFLASGAAGTRGERWLRAIRLDALDDGTPARVQIKGDQRDGITVTPARTLGPVGVNKKGSEVAALSSECPHLGCAVDLAAGGKAFGCPCHTSRFGLDGKAESGPAPRGMDALATRVVDGWVEVDFRRYRQGAAELVEV